MSKQFISIYTEIPNQPKNLELWTWYDSSTLKFNASTVLRNDNKTEQIVQVTGTSEVDAILQIAEIPWHFATIVPAEGI